MEPEAKARQIIDKQLIDAGWVIQDYKDRNPYASKGVAIREFQTNAGEEADYALFIDGTPVGLIEAKADENGIILSLEAAEQNDRYIKAGLKGNYDKSDLRFIYEATSEVIHFRDLRNPKPRSRKIFCFPRPESLAKLIEEYEIKHSTLRARLQSFPVLPDANFRKCQIEAINGLEKSFGENRPRALVQMATGAGKTYTAITSVYRLLRHAGAKRVLFLVDTNNLGKQAEMEFKNYVTYDDKKALPDLYNIQRIQHSNIPDTTKICISTIQRLYSMLCGDIENFVDGADDDSPADIGENREVVYNNQYPPEFFDFIFIDECHRSIYNKWRQVLEYFDAFLIGLTATPAEHTYAFFDKNVVSEYTHEQAVADGVNVSSLGTFIIETEKTKNGGVIAKTHEGVWIRDKRKRSQRWEEVEEDQEYQGKDLDNSVVNFDTIRLVLDTIRTNWIQWPGFAGREELPKTLIFAKDDSHADDIVRIAREVWGESNDFIKKITYQSDEEENTLLHQFRHEYYPRIAVTVSKIATGTDVKNIEMLVFMRDIRSENYFEQMLGRARRTLSKDELVQVTPSAKSNKLGYIVVDAVGVTKSPKMQSKAGGDPKKSVTFKKLLDSVVSNDHSEETFHALSNRISRIALNMSKKQHEQFKEISGGIPVNDLASALENAHNPDFLEHDAIEKEPSFATLPDEEQEAIIKVVTKERCVGVAKIICKPEVREFLMKVSNANDQTIDPSLDRLISTSAVPIAETDTMKTFADFINDPERRDTIDALSIIYSQDYRHRHITEAMIHDLFEQMLHFNATLSPERIFMAYTAKTKNRTTLTELVDIIQVVRYQWGQIEELAPFADEVRSRFKSWIFEQHSSQGHEKFTEEQMLWLNMIRDHISTNGSCTMESLKLGNFAKMGGPIKFYSLFGPKCKELLEEINYKLAA